MEFGSAVFIKPDIKFQREFSFANTAPLFRKSFDLADVSKATLRVCGLGYAYYFINGEPVTKDLFVAPVSNYNKTLWYTAYDVTHLLKKGKNTVAVICGNGFFNETIETNWLFHTALWRDNPKFILNLTVDEKTVLVSDGTWKCKPDSFVYFNNLRCGEYFDARKYEPEWKSNDFDDSHWQYAKKDTMPPCGVLRKCQCEPVREHTVYEPVHIWHKGGNRYIFDMGQNMSGYVRLTHFGRADEELTIRYAECIDEDTELAYYGMDTYYSKHGEFQTDKFISSGKPITWSPHFAYHGFRYIEIDGITDLAKIDVKAVFVHQQIARRTAFACSDSYMNRMYNAGVMSSYSNMFYMLTDCPTREKLGWTNDAQSSVEQMLTNFQTENLLEKWLQDIYDAMLQDGSLPGIIPSAGWGYHWGNGPVSDGILFEIPYRVYLHTRDPRLLINSLPYFDRYFAFLDANKSEDGLVRVGLHDWAAPGFADLTDVGFINAVLTCSFYKIAGLAAALAGSSAKERYSAQADELESFIKDRFIGGDGRCTIHEQCAVAMLIYYDLFDALAPLKAQLTELLLAEDFHIKCGMVGVRRLLLALNKCDLADYAYQVLHAEGYPGYKTWFDGGATTLWEKWDIHQISDSKNHHMYSDFMSWQIKTLAGISINEQDLTQLAFVLNPVFLKDISDVNCTYHTVRGTIAVAWKRADDKIILDVTVDNGVLLLYKGNQLAAGSHSFEIPTGGE